MKVAKIPKSTTNCGYDDNLVKRHDKISFLRLGRQVRQLIMFLLTLNTILINKKWLDKISTVLDTMTLLYFFKKLFKYQNKVFEKEGR